MSTERSLNGENAADALPPARKPDVEMRRQAFSRLVAQHEPILLRAARRLCRGQEDQAQDVVQDALLKGYKAYVEGRFEEGTNARAWLLRILTNGFITEYNRKQKWEAGVDTDTLSSEGDAGPVQLQAADSDRPETALLAVTLDEPLENALNALSPDLRACVVLVDIEEMSYETVALSLDVPIGTVRSRLFRARQQLHAALHGYAQSIRRVAPNA